MKFSQSTLVCLVISLCIALTSAQFFPGFGRSHNSLTQLTGDLGGPTAFSGLPTASGGRDPRQNRGPVVFPPSPQDGPNESSGVVVGASGFGFVPPQSQNVFDFYRSNTPFNSPFGRAYPFPRYF